MHNVILYAIAFTILICITIFEMSELIVDATKNQLTVRTIAIALGSAATLGVLIFAYRNQIKRKVADLEYGSHGEKEIQRLRADLDLLRSEVEELREQFSRGRTVTFSRSSACLKQTGAGGGRSLSPGRRSVTSDEEYYTDADDDWETPQAPRQTNGAAVVPASDSKEQIFAHLDQLFESLQGADEQYDTLKKMDNETPDDPRVLWRLARACQMQSGQFEKKDPRKKEKLLEGREYGQRACVLAPNEFEAIKWAAGLTGSVTDYLPTKERIEQGKVFENYLDRGLEINPRDFTILHMRGRFRYQVSQLSWVERKMAATFFGEPPSATIGEAIQDFEAADREKPEWCENLMWLGKSHLANKDKASARKAFERCIAIPPKDATSRQSVQESNELLPKC
ncbi:unnamed protein product, partial [Mesorhabditis belari]|uniref:Regulator of microtubule dynamics protein 1 n=1 Tax=Mesorhabditis belari TaxID=2138241 RepID=A0AAF3F4X4_9BILA